MLIWIGLTSFIIMLVSLSGVIVVWSEIGTWIEERLHLFTSLAAGVFLVVAAHLISHTFHEAETILWPLAFIVLGILVVYSLLHFVPAFHHHGHNPDCDHSFSPAGILFSDGLHNIGDGLLLAVSFQVSIAAGITAGVAIVIHEIVQEVSEFLVLKASGYSTARALLYNFAVSSTILIGAVGGYIASTKAAVLRMPLLAAAAGSFLVVVGHDLLPHSAHNTKGWTNILSHILWFMTGVVFMGASLFLVSG
jgi:zinc and cadmium transporter